MESTIYTVAGKDFELQHYGVKGMRWGVRRYQNADGSLTLKGRKRYGLSGSITVDTRGNMVDSGTGKRISRKTRKLIENRILSDKATSKKVQNLNKKHDDARDRLALEQAKLAKANIEFQDDWNTAGQYKITDPRGIKAAVSLKSSQIIAKNAQKTVDEAKNYYKSVQAEVDAFITSYANAHISDFKKVNPV